MSVVDGIIFLSKDETVRMMAMILSSMFCGTALVGQILCTKNPNAKEHRWLPNIDTHAHKRKWEIWALCYGVFWMSVRCIVQRRSVLLTPLPSCSLCVARCFASASRPSSGLRCTRGSESGTTRFVGCCCTIGTVCTHEVAPSSTSFVDSAALSCARLSRQLVLGGLAAPLLLQVCVVCF